MVFVIATAGHVDHGKSTLVRALTGMEPDRWAEERRRGLTIDLGFAWTTLPSGKALAFVDVPGHERFLSNMLAGVGPVPAALFVVAADEGWMPQSAEHLTALDAFGVRHGVLAITRCDIADPVPARSRALSELAATTLANIESVCVSGATGEGLTDLRQALNSVVVSLPQPDPDAPVRLWVDRAFTIRGAGTVVTGTLGAGTLRCGDELLLSPGRRRVRVRGLHSMQVPMEEVSGVSRVAVNIPHLPLGEVRRGDALVTPGRWQLSESIDVRIEAQLPAKVQVHVGSASVSARVRAFDSWHARLTLSQPLPLHIGDRLLLRDPGNRAIVSATTLDVCPSALRGRGGSARRAAELAMMSGQPDATEELRRRRVVTVEELRRIGCLEPVYLAPIAGRWLIDPVHARVLRSRLEMEVVQYSKDHPGDPYPSVETLKQRLDLADRRLLEALLTPPLAVRDGRVIRPDIRPTVPSNITAAVDVVRSDLARCPFAAPDASRLAELGLTPQHLAAIARRGDLLKVADGIYLAPDALTVATETLARLPQPFTIGDVRNALRTTRRVAVPLLELLDRTGVTERLDSTHRRLV